MARDQIFAYYPDPEIDDTPEIEIVRMGGEETAVLGMQLEDEIIDVILSRRDAQHLANLLEDLLTDWDRELA